MATTLDSAIMLVDRISSIEETIRKLHVQLQTQHIRFGPLCSCEVSSVEFHENGSIKRLVTTLNQKGCFKCRSN